MKRLNDNEVAEVAKMQKRIDDYDCVHGFITEVVNTGKWTKLPDVDYYPTCGDLLAFLQFICEKRPSLFKEYAEHQELQI